MQVGCGFRVKAVKGQEYVYFWQWLAYHNGLVAAVLIYLLLSEDGEPSPRAIPPALVLPRDPPTVPEDVETLLSIGWE